MSSRLLQVLHVFRIPTVCSLVLGVSWKKIPVPLPSCVLKKQESLSLVRIMKAAIIHLRVIRLITVVNKEMSIMADNWVN